MQSMGIAVSASQGAMCDLANVPDESDADVQVRNKVRRDSANVLLRTVFDDVGQLLGFERMGRCRDPRGPNLLFLAVARSRPVRHEGICLTPRLKDYDVS